MRKKIEMLLRALHAIVRKASKQTTDLVLCLLFSCQDELGPWCVLLVLSTVFSREVRVGSLL